MHISIVQEYISLKDKNWFKTGGPARFYSEPTTVAHIIELLHFAHHHTNQLFILGQGANILIHDEGFDGLVICPKLQQISIEETENDIVYVTAQAGVILTDLIDWCLAHNISGLEEFSGIPGTIGGSMYINLHYYQFLFEHFVHNAQVINLTTFKLETVTPAWFEFGYNTSRLQHKQHMLINTTFKLKKISDIAVAYARGRRDEIIRHRAARYPKKNTCGSFFRNFYENEVTFSRNNKRVIYVAYYLDKVGVKGELAYGDAIVSYQHANMIVNQGNATSADIINVARIMQEKVYHQFGIMPQPECQLIGFKEYPLHPSIIFANAKNSG